MKKLMFGKLFINFMFVFALVMTAFPSIASAFSGSGAGTIGDPYLIINCTQLQEMRDDLTAHYRLVNNIDCSATSGWNSGEGFIPVGDDFSVNFVGSLDGNSKTISNLFINRMSTDYVGLFGWLGAGSSVIDLTLVNVNVTGGQDVGGLSGRNYGTISNVHVSGSVTADDAAGGVVSEQNGTLEDSSSSAAVAGAGETGGLTGYSEGPIRRSYSTGIVTSSGDSTGGLVGYQYGSEIVDSYATGVVNGTWGVGGLLGYSDSGQITRSYSTGAVTASADPASAGGLIGPSDTPTVTDSFWDTQTSGQATSDGGAGKITAEMKTISTFSDGNFDIQTTTTNRNNGYPFLSWEVGDTTPVWYIYAAPLTDGDGISDTVEDAAPNGGDGNNDGTDDSQQANVVSFVNLVSNTYVTLEADSTCTITAASMSTESTTTKDAGFDYPQGLMNFTLNCGTPGFTATVTQYYHGVSGSNLVFRKFNPNTNSYTAITNATIQQVTISAQTVAKVTYQVTDGGPLDTDGAANGTIVDPVGLGQSVVGVPNTGLGGSWK